MLSGRVWTFLSATSIFHPKLAHFKLKYIKIFQHFNHRANPCKGTGPGDPGGEDRRGSVLDPAFPMPWVLESLGCCLSSSQIEMRGHAQCLQRQNSRHALRLPFLQACYPRSGQPGMDPARRRAEPAPLARSQPLPEPEQSCGGLHLLRRPGLATPAQQMLPRTPGCPEVAVGQGSVARRWLLTLPLHGCGAAHLPSRLSSASPSSEIPQKQEVNQCSEHRALVLGVRAEVCCGQQVSREPQP